MRASRPLPTRRLRLALSASLACVLACALAPARAQLVRQAPTTLTLPADLPSATGYTTENALGSLTFSLPLAITAPPGETGRVFIVEKTGAIQVVDLTASPPTKSTFLTVGSLLGAGETFFDGGESGLLSLAFHPDYATNRQFFVFYSVNITISGTPRLHQRVSRIQTSTTNPALADPATHAPLITQRDESDNHNGGDMHFGPDGYLYVSTGDEGAANDSRDNARWIDRDFHSAILRLDVDRKNVGQPGGSLEPNPHPAVITGGSPARARYSIPPDNPLVATNYAGTLGPIGAGGYNSSPRGGNLVAANIRTEFAYYGLRNPWRMSFDRPTGRLFIADVGQGAREEINLVTPATALGHSLGWPYREGDIAFSSAPSPVPSAATYPRLEPIHAYDRNIGSSITGGVINRGARLPELFERYLFSDYGSSRIFSLRWTGSAWARDTLVNSGAAMSGIGHDPRNGDVLFATLGNFTATGGTIRRLTRSGTTGTAPPATLSATGLFANLATLAPTPGLVPYDVNLPFWSDHARKRRWIALPGTQATHAITFAADAPWTFPTGTVWIKHFDLDATRDQPATARRLETRVMVKTATGTYGLSYRWRADQTEADLIPEDGLTADTTVNVSGLDRTQRWRFPARSECLACHTPAAGHSLSFHTRQLHRPRAYGSLTDDQINHLASAGYLSAASAPTPAAVAALPAHPALDDPTQSLEHRVRAYLAVNCVSCHVPGGAGLGDFDVRAHLSTAATRLRTGALINNGGDPAARLLAPGDAPRSMLLRRILGDGVPRMPPLATNELDPAADSLLRAYIAQLPSRPTLSEWQTTLFGSTTAPAAAPTADPDGDGANNRLEYLAGTPPLTPGPNPLATSLGVSGGDFVFEFLHPADRSAIVETSTDLTTWSRWLAPGNAPLWPAADLARQLRAPLDGDRRFFRVRLEER